MGEETNATEPIMNFAETLHDFEKISRRCRDMLYEAHEREVDALRGDTYLDAVSDSVLAKHGLVRLPVDADGVRWTGEEQYATFDGSEYNVECLRKDCHGWMVQMIDLDVKQFRAPTELCRHVPDEPADPHAELADELDRMVPHIGDGDYADELRSIADRLRKMGSAERAAQTSAAPSGHAASRSSGSSTSTRTKRRTAPSAANSLRGMRAAHGRITAPTAGRG